MSCDMSGRSSLTSSATRMLRCVHSKVQKYSMIERRNCLNISYTHISFGRKCTLLHRCIARGVLLVLKLNSADTCQIHKADTQL